MVVSATPTVAGGAASLGGSSSAAAAIAAAGPRWVATGTRSSPIAVPSPGTMSRSTLAAASLSEASPDIGVAPRVVPEVAASGGRSRVKGETVVGTASIAAAAWPAASAAGKSAAASLARAAASSTPRPTPRRDSFDRRADRARFKRPSAAVTLMFSRPASSATESPARYRITSGSRQLSGSADSSSSSTPSETSRASVSKSAGGVCTAAVSSSRRWRRSRRRRERLRCPAARSVAVYSQPPTLDDFFSRTAWRSRAASAS